MKTKQATKNYEASATTGRAALADGHWVLFITPRGTNVDLLSQRCEVYEGETSRPRLGAVHKDDMTGGFEAGMEVTVSETATVRHWRAQQEMRVPSPFAGQTGTVVAVLDDLLGCTVRFGGSTVDFPFDWLRLA